MKFDTESILDFWFAGNALTPEGYEMRKELWFSVNEEFDSEIRRRFESQISEAAELCKSGLSSDARQNLARIIATDQFPRNVYRGTAQAFAYDSVALSVTKSMIESGMHEQLSYVERMFVYMPLEHSECLDMQTLSVKMFEALVASDDNQFESDSSESIWYAHLHKEIIERFGRFPHRNKILGRESTSEEIEYLASGSENFGQVKV